MQFNPTQSALVANVLKLYQGAAAKDRSLLKIYAEDAVFMDPITIAKGKSQVTSQWVGLGRLFSESNTIKMEEISATPTEIKFNLTQQYVLVKPVTMPSTVELELDDAGLIKVHRDKWHGKDLKTSSDGVIGTVSEWAKKAEAWLVNTAT